MLRRLAVRGDRLLRRREARLLGLLLERDAEVVQDRVEHRRLLLARRLHARDLERLAELRDGGVEIALPHPALRQLHLRLELGAAAAQLQRELGLDRAAQAGEVDESGELGDGAAGR